MPTTVFLPITKPADPNALDQKHPFGVSALGFQTALGVEVGGGAVEDLPLLAVVDGQVRIHRDPPTATVVTVTLMGLTKVQNELYKLVGENVVLFVYRNVTTQSVMDSFKADFTKWIQDLEARGKPAPTLAEMQDAFLAGTAFTHVLAGAVIGKAAPSGEVGVKPFFGFEIDYLPNGLLNNEGFKRAVQLIDPANTTTRRLDPTMFFKHVELGLHPELVLAPSHAGHALLSKISQHVLVELRNEYNEPFAGVVDLILNGVRTSVNILPGDRGMMRLSGGGTIGVELADRVFTELPSGRSAQPAPSRPLTVPFHWQLQFVYMQDKDDPENWFVVTPSALPRFTSGNKVTPLLDGLETFRHIVPAIKTANASGHTLRFANWWMSHKLPLLPGDPNSSVKQLLLAAAAKDVQATLLIWQGTGGLHGANGRSSWFFNHDLKNAANQRVGFSIFDDTYPFRGSHHQKFLVVNGAQGAVAFCGGVDYRANRLDDERHVAKEGYHDTHAKVEGPAVRDLHTTFIERWNHHADVTSAGSALPTLPDLPTPPAAGSQFVQVTHTYAPRYGYVFRPAGELGTLNALRRAIQRAKRFIYFEDQYCVPYASDKLDGSDDTLHILTDLLAALDRIEFLLIVLPNHAGPKLIRRYRYQFIRALRHKGGNKVRIFYLARPGYVPPAESQASDPEIEEDMEPDVVAEAEDMEPMGGSGGRKYRDEIYLHSKLWVIDDVYAKIGCANVNRRSTTFDSEVDLHIMDGALDRGVRSAALGLRVMCWAEHLRLKGADIAALDDPIYGLNYWDNLVGGRIVKYDEEADGGKGGLFGKRARFDGVVDPDGR